LHFRGCDLTERTEDESSKLFGDLLCVSHARFGRTKLGRRQAKSRILILAQAKPAHPAHPAQKGGDKKKGVAILWQIN
jgi:hypothetical protein